MEKPRLESENIELGKEPGADIEKKRKERVSKMLELVEKINESGENLPFPGIDEETYLKMKKAEEFDPGFVTPVDEIIAKCKKAGIKIVPGDDRDSGNFFVLPADRNDFMDSFSPHQLTINKIGNEHLKELIELIKRKRT